MGVKETGGENCTAAVQSNICSVRDEEQHKSA